MTYNLYVAALMLVTTYCCLFISYLAWRRKELPIAVGLFLGMWAGAFYSFGYALEILSTNLEQIQFWLRIQYIGISFGTLIWFTMVLHYTNSQALLKKWILSFLAVVPILTFISHYTNEWHYLFYKNIVIDQSEPFPLASMIAGPFYKLHVVYSYILFVIGIGLLIQMYRKAGVHSKKQVVLMMIGSSGPFGMTLIYLSGVLNTPIDFSPFGFLFSGIFYIWVIYHFNFLKLAPLALQKVFESMKDAVIVVDLDTNITSFNQAAGEMITELKDQRLVGQPATLFFSHYPTLLHRLLQEPSTERSVFFPNEGDPHYYDVHVSHVYNNRKNPVGKMLLLRDVTESVLAEEKLQESARLLSELNLFKDRMFTIVAHDIRDPLAVLSNLMELLREDIKDSTENHEEVVHEMEQQIDNTFKLVESLLDWFRSQREGMRFEPATWNLSQKVQKNMSLLQVKSNRKNIQMKTDIPPDLLVYADKDMLHLIIRNLLSNAIKFTDDGGSIHIKANQAEGKVIMTIIDTGRGIDPDYAEGLLLEDHPISLTGTAGERGVGLGLTLCKEFVQINGGDLWFDSVLGQGSNFSFSLPSPNGSS